MTKEIYLESKDKIIKEIQKIAENSKVFLLIDKRVSSDLTEDTHSFNKNLLIQEIDAGEETKSYQKSEYLFTKLLENDFTKSDYIAYIGGGSIGDLAGFIASNYLRGIGLIAVPSTVLSMVDSSIGGKNALNFKGYKNIIGTIYNANYIINCIEILYTLSKREFKSGIAEIIKAAALKDKELFDLISSKKLKVENISEIAKNAAKIKKEIISKDLYEKNIRMILNFGHTLAHAAESYTNSSLSHGEAVACGMYHITKFSVQKNLTKIETLDKLKKILISQDLNYKFSFPLKNLIPFIKKDKKRRSDNINIVIIKEISSPCIINIKLDEFLEYLEND